jgi:3-hydroxybutyryl-CoA dehydrogenase
MIHPGLLNRVLMLTINEAIFQYRKGRTARSSGRYLQELFEHKMGPLETADLIGLTLSCFLLRSCRRI